MMAFAAIYSGLTLDATSAEPVQKSSSLPNIVFILADDLGYSDVGYMKQKIGIQTPNIDKLAKTGITFTNAYAACPVCSPTRASILTGKYPATLKITCHIPAIGMAEYLEKQNNGQIMKEANFLDHLPLEEVTFAEAIKSKGYKTGFLGKWHLSGAGSGKTTDGIVDKKFQPENQGFDLNIGGCAYGQPKSYFSPYRNATITDGKEGEYLTDRLGDEAVRFIDKNQQVPFLLYLSTYAVHIPLQAPPEVVKKYGGNKYFAMIEKLDQNVGKILNQLEKLHLEQKTIVIFYSDNGGVWGNPPLNGNKGTLLEGGIRVPLLISWPGKINPGISCDVPVTSVDFFPTLLEVASMPVNDFPQLEGQSLFPLMKQSATFPSRAIFWHFPHHRTEGLSMGAAIRQDNWKLIWEFESDSIYLFNLKNDVGEQSNLTKKIRK